MPFWPILLFLDCPWRGVTHCNFFGWAYTFAASEVFMFVCIRPKAQKKEAHPRGRRGSLQCMMKLRTLWPWGIWRAELLLLEQTEKG